MPTAGAATSSPAASERSRSSPTTSSRRRASTSSRIRSARASAPRLRTGRGVAAASLARLREALHGREQLVRLRPHLRLVARGDRACDAVVDVVVEHLQAHVLECGHGGADLRQDVDAVALLLDHLLDPAHLPLDPAQPLADGIPVVPMRVLAHVRTLRKARSRSEFETTKTLENAIAAAATIGFRYPAIASGIEATLYAKAQKRLPLIVASTRRESLIASTAALRSPETSVRSEASIATSVPVPIAIPRSACASAGASLTPSPTIATTSPASCSRRTSAALSPG